MEARTGGYEPWAGEFLAGRSRSGIGAGVVREWSKGLPRGAVALDLGCGLGVPISECLILEGFEVFGVDASPSLVAAFVERFPGVPVACEPVEDSAFFGRTFDAVVCWGLMFLLPEEAQQLVIAKASRALVSGGRFLFTSPWQVCEWPDNLSGWRSVSLGAEEYKRLLAETGFELVGTFEDEGENHYFDARKL